MNNGRFLIDRFKGTSLKKFTAEIPEYLFKIHIDVLEDLAHPTYKLRQLKIRFWDFHHNFIDQKKYKLSDLFDGVCTYQYFYHGVLKNPAKLCWLLRNDVLPERSYAKAKKELLNKFSEVLHLDVQKNGNAKSKNINAILSVAESLEKILKNEY